MEVAWEASTKVILSKQTIRFIVEVIKTYYKTVQGDTWDLISWRKYGSEFYADVLMKANPDLMDYVIFPAGVQVIVPKVKAKAASENLPPWKRR